MARLPGCRAACVFITALLLVVGLSPPTVAQQITYEYDALGRLTVVTTPEGVAQYEYDAVGNILRITTHRYADVSGPVAILGMSPTKGVPGTTVHLYGRGFGTMAADNQVSFNGTPATVTEASVTSLAITVPSGATTGPVTLTAPQGSATSQDPFTVLHAFIVLPNQMDVALGGSVGFQATMGGTPTIGVTWRVNGTAGGSPQFGTITPAGVYTAPSTPPLVEPVTIEAVLTADPTQVATASVQVVGQVAGIVAAPPVTVTRTPPTWALTMAGPVTVGAIPPTGGQALAGPVSVTHGPTLTALSPASGPRGGSLSLTLTGANLDGTTVVRGLQNDQVDPALTATVVVAAGDGTSVSCTLTIGAGATTGPRTLQVSTPQGWSTPFDLGANRFTVTAP